MHGGCAGAGTAGLVGRLWPDSEKEGPGMRTPGMPEPDVCRQDTRPKGVGTRFCSPPHTQSFTQNGAQSVFAEWMKIHVLSGHLENRMPTVLTLKRHLQHITEI